MRIFKTKRKRRKKFSITKKELENWLFYSIIVGIVLISSGVYLIGSGANRFLGRNILILGSGIFYFSIIIYAWIIE